MFVACFFPGQSKDLSKVLKPSPNSTSSYAKQIREVHCWIEESLHPKGWQHDLLVTCRKMLDFDRCSRPCAEDVEQSWSSLPMQDHSLFCSCAKDIPRTKNEKLIDACRTGSEEDVKFLLREGAEARSLGAIHFAAARGKGSIVQALLDDGAPVDTRNAAGQTALHCASRNGHYDVVKQLLEKPADVNAKDENDQTALHGAAGHGYETVVRILLDSGANALTEDLDGWTALHFVVRKQYSNLQSLLESRSTASQQDNS